MIYYRYPDDFTKRRRLAFLRSRCQAKYRNEAWSMTFEEWCEFWRTEQRFDQRGRKIDHLTLVRINESKPWSPSNCAIITRLNQLLLARARQVEKPTDEYFIGALVYGQ
jgi:hypothetical protein